MKTFIHIDNYESFYLDYLEGTLSDEERMAFEEFLAAHPELEVDEALFFLDDTPETLDPLQKMLLKKEALCEVTPENLDYLAIGTVEQVLSLQEEAVFEAHLAENPEAQKLVADYRETRLKPVAVVYPNKETLKEKDLVLIPWKMIGGIAAAAAVLLVFFQLGFNDRLELRGNTVAQNQQKEQEEKPEGENPSNTNSSADPVEETENHASNKSNAYVLVNTNTRTDQNNKVQKTPSNSGQAGSGQTDSKTDPLVEIKQQQTNQTVILSPSKDDKQLATNALTHELNKSSSSDLTAHAAGNASNMKNPIPLITTTLSEKTNTPVDFQTGKATETQKGGFYVKIGKFEISHKSSKKK